jgi:hypothetical protein
MHRIDGIERGNVILALLVGLRRIALSAMVCYFSYCHVHMPNKHH